MISKDYITGLCEDFLQTTDNYLIEVKVSQANKIIVHIENDQHVSIKDCIALSRHIEHSLDREQEDFELEVSSPGIDQPFKNLRQYRKYLGKNVEVKLANGIVETGKLLEATAESIEIEPEKLKKKKNQPNDNSLQLESKKLPLQEVKETRLKLIF